MQRPCKRAYHNERISEHNAGNRFSFFLASFLLFVVIYSFVLSPIRVFPFSSIKDVFSGAALIEFTEAPPCFNQVIQTPVSLRFFWKKLFSDGT